MKVSGPVRVAREACRRGRVLPGPGKPMAAGRTSCSVWNKTFPRLVSAPLQRLHLTPTLGCGGCRTADLVGVEGGAGLLSRGLIINKIHRRFAGRALFPPVGVGGFGCCSDLNVRNALRALLFVLFFLLLLLFFVLCAVGWRGVERKSLWRGGCLTMPLAVGKLTFFKRSRFQNILKNVATLYHFSGLC